MVEEKLKIVRTIPSLRNLIINTLKKYPEFICGMIENGVENIPEKWNEVRKQNFSVDAYECHQFVNKVPSEFIDYFFKERLRINPDKVRMIKNKVNPPYKKLMLPLPDDFSSIYSRLYFTKLVYNIKREIGHYDYVDDYATIFPFRIYKSVPEYTLNIWASLDDDFFTELQNFLNEHFDKLNFREVGLLFLRNIHHFKEECFSQTKLQKDYLDNFPRLNDAGVVEYQSIYEKFKIVMKLYRKKLDHLKIHDENYFKSLPETNFEELFSLLDPLLMQNDRNQYTYRFQKYIFFFVHASGSVTKPVFFIDDALFECLKSLKFFKTCEARSGAIRKPLTMLSLVYLRTKVRIKEEINFHIDLEVLDIIDKFTRRIPNVKDSQINLCLKTNYLTGSMLLRTEHNCYDIRFSTYHQHFGDIQERILCSLLSDEHIIKNIIVYNLYLDIETTIEMPSNRDALKQFVLFFNKHDFSKELSPIEFITKEHEYIFEHKTE